MTSAVAPPLLRTVRGPADVRRLPAAMLPELAARIRAFLIENVSRTGGHLGPNLGVVELTIALHRVFASPRDKIVFDTGHQSYVHKVLTGRWNQFPSLRQPGGLSGYPAQAESVHDVMENSHASTALSYADGLAKALDLCGATDRRVVAVVGDGALTGGLSWEGLNNISGADRPVVIVLNDNGRSYAPTVGGLGRHLADLRARTGTPTLFENLGLAYIGPVPGHDVEALERALRKAADLHRPVVVHAVTVKGKGFAPAEQDVGDCLHAVGVIDPATGESTAPSAVSWTSVFGREIVALGEERPDIVCLTAAMLLPVGLGPFAERFPDRVFDVGIAEQHAVTSAAGLAMGGMHPVVPIYSTFLNRAFDQLVTDVAMHRLPVTFVLDRAGITGPDGASHHGMWDASVLPVVPGLRLAAPRDPTRLAELLREAVTVTDAPTVLRYPKATAGSDVTAQRRVSGMDVLYSPADQTDQIHQTGQTDQSDTDGRPTVLLVAVGPLAGECVTAAEELERHDVAVTVVDPRWIAPIDHALVELAAAHDLALAVEDTVATGSTGARLAHALATVGAGTRALPLALPRRFLTHGSRGGMLAAHGLDSVGIAAAVLKQLEHPVRSEPAKETS
ncbi:1-deoxy-D-xylulose-5-phosphate synthase [Pseudonocardia sp. TRM90224]|uniref:1-deoxy-D-xylulose-5-phosphate synthase n=1 Tax=Pseudonocardia sp. TRM90224 TaxID=2812678 RepID=UPI001E43D18B|nr:1-deoxy-D-xylulose-5-phosphate synthase [Pseudonocardia sp. TRM90224]